MMKVLWIVNVELPDIALEFKRDANTGGWLNTVAAQFSVCPELDLFIACPCREDNYSGYKKNNVLYYSLAKPFADRIDDIITEVNPDLIHIWGTELEHALDAVCVLKKRDLLGYTIVSIQGLVSACAGHYIIGLPAKTVYSRTLAEFIFRGIYLNIADAQKTMEKAGKREMLVLQKSKFCIGRTDWDYALARQINPQIKYFHCNETLRESFYRKRWNIEKCCRHTIFFGQSHYPVKGVHIFIEALAIIKKTYQDVNVKIIGKDVFLRNSLKDKLVNRSYPKYLRKLIKKYDLVECIEWIGAQTEEQMVEQYCSANVFVSSSLIENSSNSIGEAMLLGMPIVASDVGGIKSLLEHNREGILYQETAPYMLADGVMRIFENDALACELGENAHKRAMITHDKEKNKNDLLEIYQQIARSSIK